MTLMCRAAVVLRRVQQYDATLWSWANHQMNSHGLKPAIGFMK